MKKVFISAYSMDVGGIETALITLIKNIHLKYKITLALEKKEGLFLNQIPTDVRIISYKASENKNVFIRKASNFIKQLLFRIKYKNRFDFSACYATYSFPCSFMARNASKNSALWVHNDYYYFYDKNEESYRDFFIKLKINEYKKIVFVSENDKNTFLRFFNSYKEKCFKCNNLIDYKSIVDKSKEEVKDFDFPENINTFINLGRHDEKQKKLSRIINVAKRLNEEGYIFRILFIGTGQDTDKYKNMAEDIKNIYFLGAKSNPYPYLKNSDCLLMSSDFEGYPVVFVESLILGKPIITTDVSDSKNDIDNKFGIVTEKNEEALYQGIKRFLDKKMEFQKFNPEEFNKEILENLDRIISI